MEKYLDKLEEGYRRIYSRNPQRPTWGVSKKGKEGKIHPAIPFVGSQYETTKLLLYASAENLTYYEEHKNDNWLECNVNAIHRRKINRKNFFPEVHIAPVNDGSLLIVAAYIIEKLGINPEYSSTYEFIENIAIDNFCKFSISTQNNNYKNIDYANDIDKH